ncbi:MAG: hypothetical protein DRP42_02050 [Tenericutes bacterium]|nr:MAG: hypothetical protein DRP42_02050 [Mycoplasmatota bacterium]
MKKFNVATPGRNGAIVETKTKADYQKRQEGTSKKEDRSKRVDLLVKNLGGLDNLDNIDACITRLRLTVKDRSIVDDAELKKMGAAGIVGNGTSVQVIFGGEADIFKTEIKALKFNQ